MNLKIHVVTNIEGFVIFEREVKAYTAVNYSNVLIIFIYIYIYICSLTPLIHVLSVV